MDSIYIFIFIFTLFFIVLYFIYLFNVICYIKNYYSLKKLSIHWFQYLITCVTFILFLFIYLVYLLNINNDDDKRISIFSDNSVLIALITIFLVANTYINISNIIFDSFASLKLSFYLNKLIKINSLNLQELSIKISEIKTNILNSHQYIIYWGVSFIINIILVIVFEIEYFHYDDENSGTPQIFRVETFIQVLMKSFHIICFFILIISVFIMNYFRKQLFMKNYYNEDKFGMKIYNIKSCQIIYNSDIIVFKTICDFIISMPISVFLIFNVHNGVFFIISECLLFLYILLLGALYFKIDKNNNIGKISRNIKMWFLLKSINFHFGLNDHMAYLNENTYKYNNEEKDHLRGLKLNEIEGIYDDNKNNEIKIKLVTSQDIEINNIDEPSSKKINSKMRTLNFETNSELYVLYKLLMLYFDKNESIYTRVQREIINDDGMPFKRFFTEKNFPRNKKKSRQTFGVNEIQERKNNFVSKIERISRISKFNSTNIISSLKFKENKIFISLEEKELREEFKKKFDYSEKDINFKIESLSSMAFFELFPFYQISIKDIQKALNPSDNKKIYKVLTERNMKNKMRKKTNKNDIESESENNLYYTYNSLLMMEIYEPQDFISFEELNKFTLSYGTYLIDIIKNINYTFIPLILGVFNVEICGQDKIVILYRNPLYFTNFYRFNHWINFFITEGPEKLKVSLFQSDIIDVNEIEIKNSLKMNENDYEEIMNNIKRDFNFFMKMNIQIYPIIHLFIGDDNNSMGHFENDANESSLLMDISNNPNNFSDILNNFDEAGMNFNIKTGKNKNNALFGDEAYLTETNSLVEKEYYSSVKSNYHTLKIYFTHFFRLDCELNKQNNKNDNLILKSNPYCQYLEGQLQTYLTKTTLFELDEE